MNYKEAIIRILESLKNPENSKIVSKLLEDTISRDEQSIQSLLEKKYPDTDITESTLETILTTLINKALEQQSKNSEAKYPLNDMFYYGISGNCVHIHLVPKDLHDLLKKGPEYLVDTVNMYMLDAIDKLKDLKVQGDIKFDSIDNVYMITPMYHSPTFEKANELEFLRNLLFKVNSYSPENLQDNEYLKTHPEAQLAKDIFGDQKKVATAIIGIDTLAGEEWQTLKEAKFEEYRKKGLTLPDAQDHEDR